MSANGQDSNNRTYHMVSASAFSATKVACYSGANQTGSGLAFAVTIDGVSKGTCTVAAGNRTGTLTITATAISAGSWATVAVTENAGASRQQTAVAISN
jgi:hypothetical protein